jgi:hypothetical protein
MKFTIRDLLLVTAIVALAVGWWLDRSHLAQENRRLEMQEELRRNPLLIREPERTPEPGTPGSLLLE